MDLSRVNNLLVIRLSSLGDILLTTPLVRSIKKQYPQISISFMLKEQYKNLLKYNPNLSEVYLYKKEFNTQKNIQLNGLKSKKFDLIIDLQNNFRSNALSLKLGAPVKRFKKKNFYKLLLVYLKINRLRNEPPIPERYSRVLKNFELDEEGLDLFMPDAISSKLSDDKKYVGFAPGSRHFTKMWPKKYFTDLGNFLGKSGITVVLFGGKDDMETCRVISDEISGSINLCNNDDIFETAVNMKKCSALLCNDSGMMHVSCALKIPVIAIFGSTVEEFGFAPYKNKNIILENGNLSCRPCSHIGKEACPKKHFKCMTEITPLIAFNKLKLLLESR